MWSWNMFNLLLFTEFIKEKYLDWMRKKPATFLQWYSWNREYKILYYLDKQRELDSTTENYIFRNQASWN